MTFNLHRLDIDSRILNLDAWNIENISKPEDFADALNEVRSLSTKYYASCKIPIENIHLIHAAEDSGFSFVETQFQTRLRLRKTFDTSRYPYEYVLIETDEHLHEVLEIAEQTIEHDRFSRDPKIGKNLSGLRYRSYLENSYERDNEEIWAVRSKSNGQLLTFRSHQIINDAEVRLLIGGVHPSFKDIGLGIVSSHFCFNQLQKSGYKRATTNISAANTPIVNLEVGHLEFRIVNTYVVMRALT